MPLLEEVDAANEDTKVIVVNVGEDLQSVQDYAEEGGYDLTILLDPDALLSRKYLISGVPTTYFIATDGANLGAYQGMLPKERAEMFLEAIRENKQ
ncbi:TlpA family protein disulfide reductase [Clostridia bacterium]|nr:TlpA family protein disulfide reductase [Clostridia bacterium]